MQSSGFAAALLIVSALWTTRFAAAGDRVTGRGFATRSEVIARHGMAATSQPLATQIALDILKQGGSAVDAAIAANAALGLMEPTGNGIGGDLFAIVWDPKTGKLHGLNASGRSPSGLTREKLLELVGDRGEIPSHGPLPVSVPGCVDGWFALHQRFGKLPIGEVLAPAIRYAREGFPVSELIAYYWAFGKRLERYEGFADTFLPGGAAPGKGEIFRNPRLASTLEKLGAGGREAFYKGELADVMDAFCQRVGCYLRKRDFAEHASTWVEPVSTNYRGYDVWELPPNGQGIAALQMLNILEGHDLAAMGHNSAAYLHHLVEAKKLAFEDRARYYADPDFASVPVDWLISKDYAVQRRELLNPERAGRAYPFGEREQGTGKGERASRDTQGHAPDSKLAALNSGLATKEASPASELATRLASADRKLRDGDTIYLATADSDRMMVSLIQSNYRGFGSGLCPDGLGFCFQDRGELFTLEEGHPNVYEPQKRPFHTIIPAFITRDGKPLISFGVMGGDMQPQGHVQIVCNLVDFGLNLQEAGDAARFHHEGSTEPTAAVMSGGRGLMTDGGTLSLESGVDAEVVRQLTQMGHALVNRVGPYGGYQAIRYDAANDVYIGASESRKDGQAAGY